MYGADSTAQKCWQHTTVFRKVAALAYYSSNFLVVLVVCCTVSVTFLRKRLCCARYSPGYAETVLYVLDCIFVAYIMIFALMNKAVILILVYVTYYFFLQMHTEIQYMFTHFYFLALFPMLSQMGA